MTNYHINKFLNSIFIVNYIFMSGFKAILILAISLLLVSANDCQFPLFYEFIQSFILSTEDIKGVTQKELSRIQLSPFTNQNVTFSNIEASTSYDGQGKTLQNKGLLVNVVNDSLSLKMSFGISVSAFTKKKNYTVSAGVDKILISYTKRINNKTQKLEIANVAFKFNADDINTHFFPENITAQELKKANQGIKGNSTSSIYNQLKKVLSSLQDYMNDHVKTQSIGKLFPNGNYSYGPQGAYRVNLDLSSSSYTYYQDSSILENGLKGYIWNATQRACSNSFQSKVGTNHTFITKQFALNLLKWGMQNLPSFNNIYLDRSKYKKSNFQFRLVDLEYILPAALQKYSQEFLSQITFSCKVKQLDALSFGTKKENLYANITWSCVGELTTSTQKIKILEFQPHLYHNFEFKIYSDALSVYANQAQIIKTEFNTVDDMSVVDIDTANAYMKTFLYSFATYVIGTHFQVKPGTNTILTTQDGIWLSTSAKISDS